MYDPNNFDTYIGEPTKCGGCGYKGDPEQEGCRVVVDGEEVFFCRECDSGLREKEER